MKVLHVPFTYAPDPIGGTEVYVENLIVGLRACGVDGAVAAPGKKTESYEVGGIPIRRYSTSARLRLEQLYGDGDSAAAGEFGRALDEIRPDLVHVHAFTSASSTLMLREVLQRGLRVVFTFHTPAVTCSRGTLLEFGSSICNGLMEPVRCAKCTLHGRGAPHSVAAVVAMIPQSIGRGAAAAGLSGSIWTALRMRELQSLRQKTVRKFLGDCDRIVVPSKWVRDVLTVNGIPAEKLVFCRQGVGAQSGAATARSIRTHGPLRVAWLGRLHPMKGLHVLVEALAQVPDLQIELDAYAVVEQAAGDLYVSGLRKKASNDRRIRLLPALEASQVVGALAGYDVLAVPSQWLETGPLVVLEALAAGVPVVGSDLGGIAELVDNEKNGLLVDAANPRAWSTALGRLSRDRALLSALASNISQQRTMGQVAVEMLAVYQEVLQRRAA